MNYKQHKYHAQKSEADGIMFDSKAEMLYYLLHRKDKNMKMQETFVLQEKFRMNGKTYKSISYRPDFTFYDDDGNLLKVVDVKGVMTDVFKLKAKLFSKRYGLPITIAKKVSRMNMFVEEDY